MAANPLIDRFRWSVRSVQFWMYVGFYAVVVGLIVLINWALYRYQNVYKDIEELCQHLYYQLLIVLVAILHVWTTYNSGTTIGGESARKTYDFFRLLPLPAWRKATGILIGRNLVPLLLAGATCLFLFVFGYSGEVSSRLREQVFFTMVLTAVLLNVLVLLVTLQPRKKRGNPIGLLIIILFALLIPISILMVIQLMDAKTSLDKMVVHFYGMGIPILVLISLLASYLTVWGFIGIVRKLRLEQYPLFSAEGAMLFVLGYCAILLGLFWPYLSSQKESAGITAGYWFLSFMPLLFVPFGALRTFDNYLEQSRLDRNGTGNLSAMLWRLVQRSNISLGLALFLIYAAPAILVSSMTGFAMSTTLHRMVLLCSFYVFFLLLLETGVVYQPLFSGIGIVLGTFFFLYLALPLMASAIMNNEVIYIFSPLGAFGWMFFGDPGQYGIRLRDLFLINVAFSIIPLRLIWKRYRYLLSVRQKM